MLSEIGSEFTRTTGHKLDVISGLPAEFARRINAGKSFDVVVSGRAVIDGLIRDGRVVADTRIDLVRSGIGVEVRAGAPKPDISSVDAFKRALLNAKSIGYLKVGSGAYLAPLLERLGIAEAIASKVTRPDTDIVSELVAKGEVELGMVVITQIMTTPGCDWSGSCRRNAVLRHLHRRRRRERESADAARALLEFLQRLDAVSVITTQGMEACQPGVRC